jgi:hypothetical protein
LASGDPLRHLLDRHGIAPAGPEKSKRAGAESGLWCDVAAAALGAVASAATAAETLLLRRGQRVERHLAPGRRGSLEHIPIEFE